MATTMTRTHKEQNSKAIIPPKRKLTATAELDAEIAADAAAKVVAPDMLARIVTKADELQKLKKRQAKGAEVMKQLESEIRAIECGALPNLMDEAEIRTLGLADDFQLVRGENVYASISKANERAATDWLIAHNYGAIIKARIIVEVEKGDVKILEAARRALAKAKIGFEETSGVHHSTLKAFVTEMIGKGKKLPKAITFHQEPVVEIKSIKPKVIKNKILR